MSMTITSVLVANRGEIARRIIAACHRLGLRAIAVYSDADRLAPYVEEADAAVHIGPAEARNSYLDIDRLIAAAHRAGADAVHPGYGFLAENAGFAQACRDAGLTFVGPHPDAIALMGSKIKAKGQAELAGVPVVPGYYGDAQDDATLLAEAEQIGLPLLIKASAGGGGRGMRRVRDMSAFLTELAAARGEAEAAFGCADVLLERLVENARHIEVQILADRHGAVRHLFERDCSLQRNHQKVIEEAPAPDLPDDVRAHLLDAACTLASSFAYEGAGTVEFLCDVNRGEVFFLEMNTRLQVEHPVTELVTGIDIVEWQLRIAGGEAIAFTQDSVTCTGWAVEARVAAEDPAAGYRPETGRIQTYREPGTPRLRIDSGIRAGSEVSHHYDSLLAKVIGRGRDRETAIRTLRQGLDGLHITGLGTNIDFLRDLLERPDFRQARHHTASLDAVLTDGWAPPPPAEGRCQEAALARLLHHEQLVADPWRSLGAWRVTEPSGRPGTAVFHLDGDTVAASGRAGGYRVSMAGAADLCVEGARLDGGRLVYESDGLRHSVPVDLDDHAVTLHGPEGRCTVPLRSSRDALLDPRAAGPGEGNIVVAPMPGLIADVLVAEGDRVAAGQGVMVLEAMKLLQTLTAPCDGIVARVDRAAGETVDAGDNLVLIEPED